MKPQVFDTSAPAMAPAPAAMDTGMKLDTAAESDTVTKTTVTTKTTKTRVLRRVNGTGMTRDTAAKIVTPLDSVLLRDSGKVPLPPPPLTRVESLAIEKQFGALRPASISFEAPDTLFIGKPESVTVTIDPHSPPQSHGRDAGLHPDSTHITSLTEVCLAAPGFKVEDEAGAEKNCREQIVPFTRASHWHWNVTALPEIKESGPRPIDVTVNALLDTLPKYTVYTSHHEAYVHVNAPGTLQRLVSLLDQWKALLLSIAGIVAVIAPTLKWLMSRRSPP